MSCYVMICSHILLERYSVVVNRWGGEGNKQQMHGGLCTLQRKMLLAVRIRKFRKFRKFRKDQTLLLRKTHTQRHTVVFYWLSSTAPGLTPGLSQTDKQIKMV